MIEPGAASKLNLPSKSVITPFVVPFTITLAPMTYIPVASFTVPVILFVCCMTSIEVLGAANICGMPPSWKAIHAPKNSVVFLIVEFIIFYIKSYKAKLKFIYSIRSLAVNC